LSLPKCPDILAEAMRIIETTKSKGIPLRLMGASSVLKHSPRYAYLFDAMNRKISDIDVMSLEKYRNKMMPIFTELGYAPRARTMQLSLDSLSRHIYDSKTHDLFVDVFFDKLSMCHTIDFTKRLEVDYPTIPLAELLLEKMQIVKLNEKDVKDVLILLLEHDVGDSDKDTVNGSYITKILSKDWGFYYTVTTNLKTVRDFAVTYNTSGLITEENKAAVHLRIGRLLDLIEKEPKSMNWKMRAKVGTRRRWYEEVEDIYR
jgi:hypothetical protein